MKYLRKFATEADVDVDASPNVVLVADSGEVKYNVPMYKNGVYIQHIDGKLYTTEKWSAKGFVNEDANGVAVIADECKFVIAKSSAYNSSQQWASNNGLLIENVTTTASVVTAKQDYLGLANTNAIISSATRGAAYYCSNYSFPNGARGYLASLGEWSVAYQHRSEIIAAQNVIGEADLGGYVWTSTQGNNSQAWYFRWSDNDKALKSKKTVYSAIPFTSLDY